MFYYKLMKKIGSCLFLFILCFGLISCTYANDVGIDKEMNAEELMRIDPTFGVMVDDSSGDADDTDSVANGSDKEDFARTSNENTDDVAGIAPKNNNEVLAGMKDTGMPYFFLALLVLLSLIGIGVKRKF